ARQLREGSDDRARHHQLDIVMRMVGFLAEEIEPATGIDTVSRPDPVLALVPAAERDVDAAAKRDLIIDDDDFLMMARAEGDCVVGAIVDIRWGPHAPFPARKRLAFRREEN